MKALQHRSNMVVLPRACIDTNLAAAFLDALQFSNFVIGKPNKNTIARI